ncbi:MAG: hypothetical protein JXA22_04715 [Candidatus Thermoplasmatota archaeon]|nr:hypothetical protein [Candidatus Thermoplasmatota archaeon]
MAAGEKSVLSGIGTSLHDLNIFLFEKNKKAMYLVALITIPGLTGLVFKMEADDKAGEVLGSDMIKEIIARFGGGGGGNTWDFADTKDFEQMRGVSSLEDYVTERTTKEITINANDQKVIEKLSITLTWQDETDPPGIRLRRYQNQPDTFAATLVWPDGNNTSLGETDTGRMNFDISFTQEQMEELYGSGDFRLRITCTSAGDWESRLSAGILTMPDTGNDVSVNIEEVYWAPPAEEE